MVSTPLKIWVRQLGSFFPTEWKVTKSHGSSHHQPAIIPLKWPFIVDLPIKHGDFPFILPYFYLECWEFRQVQFTRESRKIDSATSGQTWGSKLKTRRLGNHRLTWDSPSNDPMIQWYRIWTQKFVEEKTFEINMYKDWNFSNFSNKAVVLFTSQKEELCISWVPQYTHYNDLPICGSTTLQFLTYAHAHKQYMDKVWLQHLQSCVPFTTQYLIQFWLVVQ